MARVKKKSFDLEKSYLVHILYEALAYIIGGVLLYLAWEKGFWFLIGVPFLIMFAFFVRRRRAILQGGMRGEKLGRRILKGLPKGYKVFQSVKLNVNGQLGEIDFLIIGKKHIFLIETKNLNGRIHGKSNDHNLFKDKYVKGRLVRNEIKNPANQIRRTRMLLEKKLSDQSMRIIPIILSVHPKAEWDIAFEDILVFDAESIIEGIIGTETRFKWDKIFQEKVVAKL